MCLLVEFHEQQNLQPSGNQRWVQFRYMLISSANIFVSRLAIPQTLKTISGKLASTKIKFGKSSLLERYFTKLNR